MTDADYQALGVVIAEAVKKSTAPLVARLAELEARAPVPGPAGERGEAGPAGEKGADGRDGLNGKDGSDGVNGKDGAPGQPGERGERGLDGEPGRDGTNGRDGVDGLNGKDGAPGQPGERGEKGLDGVPGRDGIDGKDGLDGKDGQSITLDDVAPLIESTVAKAFEAMPKPQDGLGIKSALIDANGHLHIGLTNGETTDLGRVVGAAGRDGLPGVPGRWGDKGEPGLDGKNGRDGRDGTLEGLEVVQVDERSWALVRAKDSAHLGLIRLSHPLDRGVFKDGVPYEAGDGVSFGGSFFIAQRAVTTERPEDGSGAWRLAVKRGRDGREGKAGPQGGPGPKGDRGEPGRNYA